MNEKKYTTDELGICSSKIIQIDIGSRLMYSDIIHHIDIIKKDYERTPFYCIIANGDIFFDDSLKELKIIDLKQKGANLNNIKIKLVLPDLNQAITAKKMKNESKIGYK